MCRKQEGSGVPLRCGPGPRALASLVRDFSQWLGAGVRAGAIARVRAEGFVEEGSTRHPPSRARPL